MRLREICTQPYEKELTTNDWDNRATKEFTDIKKAILTEPVLQRIDRTKRQYLRTDFCALGFGFVVLQPGNDAASLEAMQREIDGGECKFDVKKKGPKLLPCSFGAKKISGYQKHVHGSYGEGLAVKYGINKNVHIFWGTEFTVITDCFAIKWLMFYQGQNPAILRLRMELMMWAFKITHRNSKWVQNADWSSKTNQTFHIDPLL